MSEQRQIPFRKGSIAYQIMLGSLQGGKEGGWADLATHEIAEVLGITTQEVRNSFTIIKRKTGYSVPHLSKAKARRRDECGEW